MLEQSENVQLWAHIFNRFCCEVSKDEWLKFVLPLVPSSWQNQQQAAKQVSNKSATNPLSTPRNGIYETTATLRVTLCFSYFMSFTAPFVCESHHLRFNRKKRRFVPRFGCFPCLALLRVDLLRCGMMEPILVFATHHCTSAPPPKYTSKRTCAHIRACTPPVVAFKCMATFPVYMAHGVPSLQHSVRSLLISSVSRLGSLPRACHGRVTLLDDRTMRFQAVVSQTRRPVSTKHIEIALSHFTDSFFFVAITFLSIRSTNKSFPGC